MISEASGQFCLGDGLNRGLVLGNGNGHAAGLCTLRLLIRHGIGDFGARFFGGLSGLTNPGPGRRFATCLDYIYKAIIKSRFALLATGRADGTPPLNCLKTGQLLGP